MSLTINSRIIADARIQGATLRRVLGAYELVFGLDLTVYPEEKPTRCASIIGARVSVKCGGTGPQQLGFARPEGPFEVRPYPDQSRITPALILPLQPGQLTAIEKLRGASDLDFELLATGLATDGHGEHQVEDTWRTHVPRSDWVKKLREAGARDILLLEVPLPLGKQLRQWAEIATEIEKAHAHFGNGDYSACVATCRTVLEELGQQKFKKKEWAGPLLARLTADRNGMTKAEREAALWGALRHYTHQAHHARSEGGVTVYSRSEAQLVLILTASFVARAQGG